jgi:polyphosphate kinase 2 (PPK2 family)
VSKREQKKRFLDRLDQPEKNWKFSAADVKERQCWDDYQSAYEEVIRNTSTEQAPWFVVPADHKWFTRLVVAGAVVDALKDMKLAYPTVDPQKRKELEEAKQLLLAEKEK